MAGTDVEHRAGDARPAVLETAASHIEKKEPEENADISFTGRLLGGCMDCLVNLLGTRYDKVTEFTQRYRDDGIIWFLEA